MTRVIVSIGILCFIAGMLITWYATKLPVYTDPEAPDRLSGELAPHMGGPIQDLDSREREWFRRLPTYETSYKKLFDLGTGLASCGIGLLAATGWVYRYLRRANLRTVPRFVIVWLLLWVIRIPGLFWYYGVRESRYDYPTWADAIAIPIFYYSIVFLLGGLFSSALLYSLLCNRSFPLRIMLQKPSSTQEWARDVAICLWLLILVLLVGEGILDGDVGLVFSCIIAWVMLAIVLIAPVKAKIDAPICIAS